LFVADRTERQWLDSMPASVLTAFQLFFVQKQLAGAMIPHLSVLHDKQRPCIEGIHDFLDYNGEDSFHQTRAAVPYDPTPGEAFLSRVNTAVQADLIWTPPEDAPGYVQSSGDQSKRARVEVEEGSKSIMVVLSGLPGSGKSTLCDSLAKNESLADRVVRLCQDDIGKDACERGAHAAMQDGGKVVLIDRTNINREQRALWVGIAKRYKSPVFAVVLDLPREVCMERAMKRSGHATLPPSKVPMVVGKLAKAKQDAQPDEGFDDILVVSPTAAEADVIAQLTQFIQDVLKQ
jgi:predicted kinase